MEVLQFTVRFVATLFLLSYPISARVSNRVEEENNPKFKRDGETGSQLVGGGDTNQLLQAISQQMADIDSLVVKCTKDHLSLNSKVDKSSRDLSELEKKVGEGGSGEGRRRKESNPNLEKDVEESKKNISELKSKIHVLSKDVANLQANPGSAPTGSTYIQLPKQSEPSAIWPKETWSDETEKYAGLFFRAEGNGSLSFGTNQKEGFPRISYIQTGRFENMTKYAQTRVGGYITSALYTGGESGTKYALTMLMSNSKNYPKNTAIRIWKRTK